MRTLHAKALLRLTDSVPGFERCGSPGASHVVGVVPGEGIGPEIVAAAVAVLEAVARANLLPISIRTADVPIRSGHLFAEKLWEFCDATFAASGALLCGPVGGRFVYDLRARFDLYCKLVPLRPSPALADIAIVRLKRLQDVDVLIVRENVGGLYAGEFGRSEDGRVAYQQCTYRADQVARLVTIAADLAGRRRGRLAVIVKSGGIPEVSALWREQAEVAAAARDVQLELLEVDNASFQLIAHPSRFDVIAAPNLLGDVLADTAAVLLGSRGMSYSGNFGPSGRAVYQTGHGAAYDLAGSGTADPVAQILSVAMMLRESFAFEQGAAQIEAAVERVLAAGWRTPDIAGPRSRVAGTRELAERIAEEATQGIHAHAEVS
jgi:3-isopropylmalate dehydrogenase